MATRTIPVLSHLAIDLVTWREHGRLIKSHEEVGGAGAYAAVGAALIAQDPTEVQLIAGVGRTQIPYFKLWCDERAINANGLFEIPGSTPITSVQYETEESRTEIPLLGETHFHEATPLPKHIPSETNSPVAYLFHTADPEYWAQISEWKARSGVRIVWEISADSCTPTRIDDVRRAALFADVMTINRTEAEQLCGNAGYDAALALLETLEVDSVVHSGAEGMDVWRDGTWQHVDVVPTKVVDPTGGGNSFAGGLAAGLDRANGDLVAAVCFGAAAASAVISAQGSPHVNRSLKSRVSMSAKALMGQIR